MTVRHQIQNGNTRRLYAYIYGRRYGFVYLKMEKERALISWNMILTLTRTSNCSSFIKSAERSKNHENLQNFDLVGMHGSSVSDSALISRFSFRNKRITWDYGSGFAYMSSWEVSTVGL